MSNKLRLCLSIIALTTIVNIAWGQDIPTEELNAARVSAEVKLIRQNGDTLIVNTKALPRKETDDAAELLSQIPGIKVSNGAIIYNGEKIVRTYVNGTLVYGDNPASAFASLYATDVEGISIYHELSPADKHRGLKHGKKEAVINIKTKDRIITATDIESFVAGGVDAFKEKDGIQPRYSGLQTGNYYSEKLQLSEKLSADNVSPETIILTSKDPTSRPAIASNKFAGIVDGGLQRNWGDRLYGNAFHLSVGYTNTSDASKNYNSKNYLNDIGGETAFEKDTIDNASKNHQVYIRSGLDLNGAKIKSLSIGASGSFQYDNKLDNTHIQQFLGGRNLIGNRANIDQSHTWNGSISSRWSNNERVFYHPSIYLKVGASTSDGNSSNIDTLSTTILQRALHGNSKANGIELSAGSRNDFTLKNSDGINAALSIGYDFDFKRTRSIQDTYDFWPDETIPARDTNNTNNYTQGLLSHEINTGFSVYTKKFSVSGGCFYCYDSVSDLEHFPTESEQHYSFHSFLPFLKFEIGKDLKLSLATTRKLPTAQQLRGRIDDSTPYFTIEGNSDLKRSYTASANISWNHIFTEKASSIGLNFSSSDEFNAITGKIEMRDNRIWSTEVNEGNKFMASFDARYSKAYVAKKINTSYFIGTQYNSYPAYEGTALLHEHTWTGKCGADFTIRHKYFRGNISTALQFNNCYISDSNAYTFIQPSVKLSGTIYTLKNRLLLSYRYRLSGLWFLVGNYTEYSTHYLTTEIGGWPIRKKLYISISGHDLLNGKTSVNYTYAASYIDQCWAERYGRYVMLNIRYIFKTKQQSH